MRNLVDSPAGGVAIFMARTMSCVDQLVKFTPYRAGGGKPLPQSRVGDEAQRREPEGIPNPLRLCFFCPLR